MEGKKYKAEQDEVYSGHAFGSPCLVTFKTRAASVIDAGWRYSQHWTHSDWPIQALRDCNERIENCQRDLNKLLAVRERLLEIEADMNPPAPPQGLPNPPS